MHQKIAFFALSALLIFQIIHQASGHALFNSAESTIGNNRVQVATDPEFPQAGQKAKIRMHVTDRDLIFGAVDYTKDMRVKLTTEGDEQFYARAHTAVAARAAGCIASDCPFVAFKDTEAFEKNTRFGRQLGYEGRMLIHPSQIEPSHRIYTPSPEDVDWAKGVVKVFEEEGIAKGSASVSYQGKMVDTPVYHNARSILAVMAEFAAFDAQRKR